MASQQSAVPPSAAQVRASAVPRRCRRVCAAAALAAPNPPRPSFITQAVLVPTETIPDSAVISGYDFNTGRDLDALMGAMMTSGFQATALGQAVEEVNRMVRARWCMNCVYVLLRLLFGGEAERREVALRGSKQL